VSGKYRASLLQIGERSGMQYLKKEKRNVLSTAYSLLAVPTKY
jgi:hypothetical protein